MNLAQLVSKPRNAYYALGIIVLLYSFAALTNLGSRYSPQSGWAPAPDSSAVFAFDQVHALKSVDVFHGLGTGSYRIDWSLDGLVWSTTSPEDAGSALTGISTVYMNDNRFHELRWYQTNVSVTTRYVRVQPSDPNANLEMLEIAFVDTDGKRVKAPEATGETLTNAFVRDDYLSGDSRRLFDEQRAWFPGRSWFHGMYFDEIYHARSAWEMIRGIDATENTHPPLGKIIMGFGVRVFGMNPFGYRIMGTLFGIFMLPFMFGLARRLTGNTVFGVLATLFFALDFMHYTQTRIATIDTFALLFILAAYYFMLRYLQTPSEGRFPTRDLMLSGLSIGLGIASKWICLYAAAGLSILYLVDLFKRPPAFAGKSFLTSLLAFVAIPAVIYLLAYIPYVQSIDGRGLQAILDNQTGMYDYHKGIVDTHPYSSNWYEWPIMLKPIWYYSSGDSMGPDIYSSIQAFGNPVVWFLGITAFLALPVLAWTRRNTLTEGTWQFKQSVWFVLAAALAQYLPWALIPRKLVFIYHFFATTPFLVLSLILLFKYLQDKKPGLEQRGALVWLPWGIAGLAAVFFGVFYPILGGIPVERGWIEFLRQIFWAVWM